MQECNAQTFAGNNGIGSRSREGGQDSLWLG